MKSFVIQPNVRNERNTTKVAEATIASDLAFWSLHQLRLLRTFLCSLRPLHWMESLL